ncbi:hypothetical protein L345_07241, partial [Ophiophagus hannah]
MIAVFQYLRGCPKEEADKKQRTEINQGEKQLRTKEKFPVKVVNAPTLEVFKKRLDNDLSELVESFLPEWGVGWGAPEPHAALWDLCCGSLLGDPITGWPRPSPSPPSYSSPGLRRVSCLSREGWTRRPPRSLPTLLFCYARTSKLREHHSSTLSYKYSLPSMLESLLVSPQPVQVCRWCNHNHGNEPSLASNAMCQLCPLRNNLRCLLLTGDPTPFLTNGSPIRRTFGGPYFEAQLPEATSVPWVDCSPCQKIPPYFWVESLLVSERGQKNPINGRLILNLSQKWGGGNKRALQLEKKEESRSGELEREEVLACRGITIVSQPYKQRLLAKVFYTCQVGWEEGSS